MPLLRNIIISLLVVGMVFTVFINLYADMYTNYQPYTNTSDRENELSQTYDKWNDTQDIIIEISDKIYNSTSRSTTGSDDLITSSYGTAKLYLSNIQSIFETLINTIGKQLDIPPYIRNTFIAIIVIAIVFTIISGVLRHEW